MKLYEIFLKHPVVTTDSRNCPAGSVFFALKGEKFNANEFAATALANGCAYAVIDEPEWACDKRYIVVENVLETLQELAAWHRKQIGIKIIAITGTNGKTTTKELTASVLKEKYSLHYTQGNLNNHIGVPLTLLQLRKEHQLAIIEMGANHPGEIKTLCKIAQPDFGIVTNVGKAHLEGFGSFEGVMQTKAELYDYIAAKGLGIFINADDKHLKEMAKKATIRPGKQLAYSLKKHPHPSLVTGKIKSNNPFLNMQCQTGSVFDLSTKLIGAYNAENVLAAVTIGHFFGLENALIKQGIENYKPQNNRSQLIETSKNRLIVDAYNANPTSMQAAILNFSEMPHKQKTLILGDMLELGDQSKTEHQKIVNLLNHKAFLSVYLVGNMFKQTKHSYKTFDNADQLLTFLSENSLENQTILIKGSRAIQLEKIIPAL